jgi:O-antigen ligase
VAQTERGESRVSPLSRTAHRTRRADPLTVHEKVLYGLLLALAFLMPFKFGLIDLDVLPNPSFGGPSIGSLLSVLASWPTEIAELLIILAGFFWVLNMIVTRRVALRYTAADHFLWAFLGVGLVSSFCSILPHSAMLLMKEFACWVLLYHLVVNLPGGERRERGLLAALMAGLVCVSLIGLHQRLFGYQQLIQLVYRNVPPEEQGGAIALLERARVMATYASPNSLGGLYVLLLPTACLFVPVLRQWTRGRAAPAILFAVLGPVLGFAIFILTESKGAFLSFGVTAIIAAFAMRRRLKLAAWKLVVVLALAVGATVAVSSTAPGRELIERGAYTFKERIGYWRGAARMAANRPFARTLIGSGFNAFSALFPKYKDPQKAADENSGLEVGMARSAHNNYVQLFIEVGVLGLGAFVAFWVIQLVRAGPLVGAFARGGGPPTFAALLVLGSFFGLVAFLLHSVVDFDLYVPGLAMTVMFLVGLVARHTGALRERVLVLRKELHAVVALAVLMLVSGPLVLFVPMTMTAEIHYFNAHAILSGQAIERPPDPAGAAVAQMRQALQWDPLNHNYMGYLAAIQARRGLDEGNPQELKRADEWYTRALRLDRYSSVFLYRRAIVRLDRMRLEGRVEWDAVLDEIERSVECNPTDSLTRLRYVYALDQAGRAEEARRQFDLAAKYDTEDFSIALHSAKLTYNDFDVPAELERLRAKYGAPPQVPEPDKPSESSGE